MTSSEHPAKTGMMSSPAPKRSIGAKLTMLVAASVGSAVLLGGALSAYDQGTVYLRAKREAMQATAQVFASATSRAVARGDEAAVTQALRAIARIPGLVYGQVRTADGATLAEMGLTQRLAADLVLGAAETPSPLALLTTRTLTLRAPVVDGGQKVGEIELVSDMTGLSEQFLGVLKSSLAGSLLALALGLALAFRLRRAITGPLSTLKGAMETIARTKDYSQPVFVASDDETGLLADRFNDMMREICAATDAILLREKEIIERLGRAGELRDDQTGQHVVRVAQISRIIATEIGLPAQFVDDLCRASPMHDVGKIAIRDAILHKPGRLDPEERIEMERHARQGFDILAGSHSPLVQLAAEIAISHHERWDGKGYPNRIAGDAIPISGRITAVADVCDALLSERPYKQPWPLEKVHAFLSEESGTHFDPACVAALLRRWDDLTAIYQPLPELRQAA